MIDHVEVDIPRQEILADTLGNIWIDLVFVENARFLVFLEHRAVRVDAPDLNPRIPLFEIPAHA